MSFTTYFTTYIRVNILIDVLDVNDYLLIRAVYPQALCVSVCWYQVKVRAKAKKFKRQA